jgi:hypothetical protein
MLDQQFTAIAQQLCRTDHLGRQWALSDRFGGVVLKHERIIYASHSQMQAILI